MPGMIQIYTGNGKGKTTAALGLALRALGAGKNICVIQFLKTENTCEFKCIKKNLPMIKIKCFGSGKFINKNNISQKEKGIARKAFLETKKAFESNKYDLLVLDELNLAIYFRLIELNEIIGLLENKPKKLEVVITGRYAPKELLKKADLVTEMKEKKHYFKKGIKARKGIEY